MADSLPGMERAPQDHPGGPDVGGGIGTPAGGRITPSAEEEEDWRDTYLRARRARLWEARGLAGRALGLLERAKVSLPVTEPATEDLDQAMLEVRKAMDTLRTSEREGG